jgi:hypothetical protein
MNRAATFLFFVSVMLNTLDAHADETCVVSGNLSISTKDSYQCDPIYTDCHNWASVKSSTPKPLRYLEVSIVDAATTIPWSWGRTDSQGNYSMSFTAPSCAAIARWNLQLKFRRYRSATSTSFVFVIVTGNETTAAAKSYNNFKFATGGCGSTTCTISHDLGAVAGDPGERFGTIYQTADHMFGVATSWSSAVMDEIDGTTDSTALRIYHSADNANSNFSLAKWMVRFGYSIYRQGATLRHELGHAYQAAVHRRRQWVDPHHDPPVVGWDNPKCLSYGYYAAGEPNWYHGEEGCEYGFTAMYEGMASFFGVRSAVGDDHGRQAWFCFCQSNNDPSICSKTAAVANIEDGIQPCLGQQGIGFVGVGDHYASNMGDCVWLRSDLSCNCDDTNGNNLCDDNDWHRSHGWRSEAGVYRFLWDVVDGNNNNGSDDSDVAMDVFVSTLRGMSCSTTVFQDGSCNEPNRADPADCDPQSPNQVIYDADPQTRTRDSYNVWDIAEIMPGDQAAERVNNCVQGAKD